MDLFEHIVTGDAAAALSELSSQYADGADPLAILRDIAEITHWISVILITPDAADDPTVSPEERARGREMADRLSMPVLTRMWQMGLKALEEVSHAPNAMMAAEMAVIRMTHVADLPTPGDLVAKLNDATPPPAPAERGTAAPAPSAGAQAVAGRAAARSAPPSGSNGPQAALAEAPESALARFPTFQRVVDLIAANRDQLLKEQVLSGVRLVSYQPGRIEFEPSPKAPADLAQRLGQRLQSWTGVRWVVSVTAGGGAPTMREAEEAEVEELRQEAREHPTVAAILAAFPNATIGELKSARELASKASEDALGEVEDEWDPFEDE
jgi:DNA polymerase-3 subunit gamma/tau